MNISATNMSQCQQWLMYNVTSNLVFVIEFLAEFEIYLSCKIMYYEVNCIKTSHCIILCFRSLFTKFRCTNITLIKVQIFPSLILSAITSARPYKVDHIFSQNDSKSSLLQILKLNYHLKIQIPYANFNIEWYTLCNIYSCKSEYGQFPQMTRHNQESWRALSCLNSYGGGSLACSLTERNVVVRTLMNRSANFSV